MAFFVGDRPLLASIYDSIAKLNADGRSFRNKIVKVFIEPNKPICATFVELNEDRTIRRSHSFVELVDGDTIISPRVNKCIEMQAWSAAGVPNDTSPNRKSMFNKRFPEKEHSALDAAVIQMLYKQSIKAGDGLVEARAKILVNFQ